MNGQNQNHTQNSGGTQSPTRSPKVTKYNPLYDPATDNLPIAPEVQQMINKPLSSPEAVTQADEEFLNQVLAKIETKQLNLYSSDSLLNHAVYDALDESAQGRVDQNAFNTLSVLRQIKDLHDLGETQTFQFQNLVRQIRLTKEKLEKDHGDVFII